MMRAVFLGILILLCLAQNAGAAEKNFDYGAFQRIPVLHEGRVKPLDSFARITLKTFSGRESLHDLSASAFMAEVLFDPEKSVPRKIFTVTNPELKKLFGLENSQKVFALSDLQKGLEETAPQIETLLKKEKSELTKTQMDLLRLHEHVIAFAAMVQKFSLPVPEENLEHPQIWQDMKNAYQGGDQNAWYAATKKAALDLQAYAPKTFGLEIVYNALKPFHWALGLYGLSLFALIIALYKPAAFSRSLYISLMGTGVFAHGLGLFSRIIILERPPVGTLYESVLFVSFICAAITFILALRKKNAAAILAGMLGTFALLALAPAALQSADSMEMLVAVLNTNFWLATHVLCITAGYGVCILAACLAHTQLIMDALGKTHNLLRSIYALSIVALLLTAVGTALGGIWADQSWGRFWGWDPKENGALLIVLWLIWLQHGRISKNLNTLGFVAGMAFLNVIVALAWFGVNLLSVGLHSYGFTSGIAWSLGVFCASEIVLIAALTALGTYRRKSHAA